MGSVPPELSLDLKPSFVPKSISALLKEVSVIGDFSVKATKLDDFVKRLDDEMRKIDAFKRELPLCMLLLQDAILALKGELLQFEPKPQPVLEKFIPLKDSDCENGEIEKEKECSIKKHWMSTFQLYDYQSIDSPKHDETKRNEEMSYKTATVEAFQIENHKKGIGGDKSFWHYSDFPGVRKEEREELPVPALSLLTPGMRIMKQELGFGASKASCSRAVSSPSASFAASVHVGQQQSSRLGRKQRRCWSPELHRQFVQALQELGGSQVATPKQIRELMNVNGLTNDEVKSHLQKYRIHTRRTSHTSSGTPANQSVVLGGLWMSQHHHGESSKANGSQSGSPQGPFQSGAPGSNDDDDSDDDDDEDEGEHEKAESFSWKGHLPKPIKSDA